MKLASILLISFLSVLVLMALMTYANNKRTERQKYSVAKQEDGFAIRFYPRAIMATVHAGGDNYDPSKNTNFRRLAGYIFGGNQREQKIAMTAPVYMEREGEGNAMSFVLPDTMQMDKLPEPNDKGISLHYSEEGYYAALSFGGFASDDRIAKKEKELIAMLKAAGYSFSGSFKYLGYNAPWDVIERENDILVKVDYKP